MIKLEKATLQRGPNILIDQSDLTVYPGHRCGISGANGTGKSSLFKLLLGELSLDKGELTLPQQAVIAHVAQETPSLPCAAVEYVMDGDQAFRAAERRVERLQNIDNPTDAEATELAVAIGDFEQMDGYTARARAGKLLNGLGFSPDEIDWPVSEFSGGWRMRLNLAQALMCKSDILLLDEPTNHLDVEAVMWLERWLAQYNNTLLLISHDRDFLNAVCNHIIHLHDQKLTIYKGDFDDFERMRAEKMAHQQAAYEKQQDEIAHLENFIRRFKAKASKAKQAQSRVKALEKMAKVAPLKSENPFTFQFMAPEQAGDPLLRLDNVVLGYGQTEVLRQVNLSLRSGDRYGLLGQNGQGKSTLLKHLAGDLPAISGLQQQTDRLKIGYFAQHQMDALDLEATPLVIIQRLDQKAKEQAIKNFLGGFNFKGDRVNEPVSIFSGGEKARLALAVLVWQRPNLLLLDEPTNHLDLQMRDALTHALQDFVGAIVIISHDRYLLRACCDEFLWIHDGQVQTLEGDLDDYRQMLLSVERGVLPSDSSDESKRESNTIKSTNSKHAQRKRSAAKRAELKPLTQALRQVEKRLDRLTRKEADYAAELSDEKWYQEPNKSELQDLLRQHADTKQALAEAEEEWLSLSEQIEAAEQQD